jgi:hypothetical protein
MTSPRKPSVSNLWQVADSCGVQVGTYTTLSNHFHLLVNLPQQTPVTDDELLRRYAVLYPKPTKCQTDSSGAGQNA